MNSRFSSSHCHTLLILLAAGFSLLELLVVLAILALLTAVVVPSLSHHVQSTELRNTARLLAMDLARTRSQAIVRQQQETLVLDVDKHSYRNSIKDPSRKLPRDIELILDSIRSERQSATSAAIRFFPDGSSTGGRITLRRGDRQRSIDIAWLTGRIKVHD